jgi:hypothetical protein
VSLAMSIGDAETEAMRPEAAMMEANACMMMDCWRGDLKIEDWRRVE